MPKGVEILKQTQPDIAIIDIGLPDMDGIELTQKFKQHIASSEPVELLRIPFSTDII